MVPPIAGTVHPVRFEVKSPEIVKFTEEERNIYEVLGETLKIQTSWQTRSDNLKIILMDKEPLQTVGPREKIAWPWMFQGDISQPEQVSLVTHLISPDGTELFSRFSGLYGEFRADVCPFTEFFFTDFTTGRSDAGAGCFGASVYFPQKSSAP